MVSAAASKALETFNLLGQLDVIAYAAQKVHNTVNIFSCRYKTKNLEFFWSIRFDIFM
jgi:hypothetical protein